MKYQPVAIVGLGTIMPDAQDVNQFWQNILNNKVSIRDVPASRWQTDLYYHPDRQVQDKTYSKIGSFVSQYTFEPLQWKIPIPPNVLKAMDHPQKWALACTRQALLDYGYPDRGLNTERTAVIFGNALGGDLHYTTTLRIRLPEFLKAVEETQAFRDLPAAVQQNLRDQAVEQFTQNALPITEDTMPGELSNVIAGRVANVFNFRGPNFVTDAACASSIAAVQAAVEGLNAYRFDAAVTGGIDSGMGIEGYVKFSKIGALSADGSRPYDAGANGFVMGEGAAVFLLKRLEDAEKDQDPIYAVIRGIGGSSDGSGKGITAPNPVGQVKAITRAWKEAGVDPASVGLIEGHGTSTRVGDVVEVNALSEAFKEFGLSNHSVALGSVKSNIGHLKSAAGAAGMLKTVMALHHKTMPPSANFNVPNPDIPFERMPFFVNTTNQPWENPVGQIRRAGISSFGFGGTNFHLVMEEYVPGLFEKASKEGQHYYPAELRTSRSTPVLNQESGPIIVGEIPLQGRQEVQEFILEMISEKTGYPIDMLDLELDLEADLGVDTVKQAEMFLQIREHYGIPRRDDLRLSDYNTIEKVIEFVIASTELHTSRVATSQPSLQMNTTVPTTDENSPSKSASLSELRTSRQDVKTFILEMISEKTGYPIDMLDLELDLEADLGVDTVKQAEMFLQIREHYGIPLRDDLRLSDYNTIEKVIQFVVTASGEQNNQGLELRTSRADTSEPSDQINTTAPPVDKSSPSKSAAQSELRTSRQDVETFLLEMISEKTGYPIDMLDLELDLEADLGVDTVKQAEMFLQIREHYGIPRRDDLRLSDYNTIEKVIEFVIASTELRTSRQQDNQVVELCTSRAASSQPSVQMNTTVPTTDENSPSKSTAQSELRTSRQDVETFLLEMISEKTGYPIDMLDLELDLEADLGVDTVKQAEMFLQIREHYGIPRRDDLRLSDYNTIEKVIEFVINSQTGSTPASSGENHAESGTKTPNQTTDVAVSAHVNQASHFQRQPLRGLFFISEHARTTLIDRLSTVLSHAEAGTTPPSQFPDREVVELPERIAIDYDDAPDLAKKLKKTIQAMDSNNPKTWFALAGQGIRYSNHAGAGTGQPGKVVFMFPGQGSQYVNMLRDLIDIVPVVRDTYAQADAIMTPILGKPLTEFILVDGDETDQSQAKEALKNTIITQPAVLTCNVALLRMLADYGYQPDMVVGHSLGEYAALVAAGALPFEDALRVVSARGQEMRKTGHGDGGCMAAVTAPLAAVQEILESVDGYAVIANINSPNQSVIGGTTPAIEQAVKTFNEAGYQAVKIQVSQAFHTKIVEPASQPLRDTIARMHISEPKIPIVANVHGSWYPSDREAILDILAAQVHSPVQFVQCIQTLYDAGGRVFVEVGPKRVLNVLASEILQDHTEIHVTATNHPRKGGLVSFNETIACLLAAGIPLDREREMIDLPVNGFDTSSKTTIKIPSDSELRTSRPDTSTVEIPPVHELTGSVVISGTGLGLPGKNKPVFAEDNVERLLNGELLIEPIPEETRQKMLEKSVIRLVKSEAGAQMIELNQMDQTIKLAGQPGSFDLAAEYGLPPERVSTFDISTQLAIAAGIDALREAGIPLVMTYKKTTVGSYLPDRWMLPEPLADETGVIFASAFPGLSRMADELDTFHAFKNKQNLLSNLKEIYQSIGEESQTTRVDLEARIADLETELTKMNYHLDRNFVFRVLTMGHSQFAEYIGAKGPNTHVNGACASTTQAIAIAEDWIRTGRCRRVIVIAGDDVASEGLMNWIGSALMASGAATIEGDLRLAALPFDRRRNGMIIGMGAAALVVESQDAVSERGMTGICEILSSEFANSAYHGTRLEVDHVSNIMGRLLKTAETRFNIQRDEVASKLVFVSHETYTPARGGSASAEIHALRQTFGESANQVVIANTKGYTGHSMGVGIEDVLAVKALELGKVPPIANLDSNFEADPELGDLNLSTGGDYQPDYALRLGAGFGSQLAMTLYRRIPSLVSADQKNTRTDQPQYQAWLAAVTGNPEPEIEVKQRTLRVVELRTSSQGAPTELGTSRASHFQPPQPSRWTYGQKPVGWAARPEDEVTADKTVNDMFKTIEPRTSSQQVSHSFALPVNITLADDPPPAQVEQTANTVQRLQVEPIKDYCLDLISEKTGYPVEMLDLDLDLEADLGIDTVKQAEVFAELREHYQLPRPDDLRLSDYNTIGKVIDFLAGSADPDQTVAVKTAEISPAQPEIDLTAETPLAQTQETEIIDKEAVSDFLLALVSEKTGYPADILDPELDLEADLGIDTVKQAELFAAVREHYNIPHQENLVLSEYNSLKKLVQFVMQTISLQAETPQETPEYLSEPGDQADASTVIHRRVPVPVLRPKLSLCQPTGLQLKPGDRVLVVTGGNSNPVAAHLTSQLEDLGVTVDHIQPGQDLDTGSSQPCTGIFMLAGWAPLGETNTLTPAELGARLDQSLYQLFKLVNAQDEPLSFVISATQTGGLHGYGHATDTLTLTGALSGFSKSLAREQTQTLVKVVDFELGAQPEMVAARLLAELESDPDLVEIGWLGDERYTIQALSADRGSEQNLSLDNETVFLISGGAGGITVPVVADLARRTGGKFILFGRTEPTSELRTSSPGNPALKRVLTDRRGMKEAMITAARNGQEKINPAHIERQLTLLENQARIQLALEEIAQSGGEATYYACDVTDPTQVNALVDQVMAKFGRVDILIHAAGIEKSRLIKNKSAEEFRQVFEVKVMGFLHLMHALIRVQSQGKNPLQAVQVFSSVAGRFGNPGQSDYAAANDTLCRWIMALQKQMPAVKFQALDWSAWDEVGMATRGFVPTVMERAGIDMLPVSAAAPQVAEELCYGMPGEVILAGRLGMLEEHLSTAGEINLAQASEILHTSKNKWRLFDKVVASNLADGITLAGTLDPTREIFLQDHALRGIPVMPGVMGIEGFVTAAEFVVTDLLSENQQTAQDGPYCAHQVTDVQFQQPLKFYRDEPRKLLWKVQVIRRDDTLTASIRLQSVLETKLGESKLLEHFSGIVHLAQVEKINRRKPENGRVHNMNGTDQVDASDIYQLYFHGPAFQVLQGVQQQGGTLLGRCQFSHLAEVERLLSAHSQPLLVESCFQTAGVWEIGHACRFSLPQSIGKLNLFPSQLNGHKVYTCVKPRHNRNGKVSFDAYVVDDQGQVYLEMQDYQTAPLLAELGETACQPFRVITEEKLG